ncbi:heptaprenyl diphosphate synthase component 1 [Salipaludibacillus sp. CUR1]|uniref:heptaprenyl diphosphate synthase component 1 n=1 Tax=Salipaludibacillus sp. CUR1 TaxID=2820003 RepID=UPI001E3F59D1|nr:heptaprenyl diphosphate synthase component 1 [Salipaludibacillus sp. CUR1]MCE7791013.1 heptaprenyl diphosphate synthase component 1 [Salipaludibacillus sp. CUR1]
MRAFDNYNKELNRVFDSFYTRVNHPYIKRFLEDPVVDADQAAVLFYMLKDKGYSRQYIHDCILTAMFVQAALDTHETVNVHGLGTETLKTKRQLTVLAGDYYSSLYYYVLAQLGDVPLIRVMAKSIQDINESKMSIYKQHKKKYKPGIRELKNVYTSLLKNIAVFTGSADRVALIEEFFLFKSLLAERDLFLDHGYCGKALNLFCGSSEIKLNSLNEKFIIDQFNIYIEASMIELEKLLRHNNGSADFIQLRYDELIQKYRLKEQCAVEEG